MAASPQRSGLMDRFVAHSPAMLDVLRRVELYARACAPLVLVGATGTGKTTLAELIHRASGRRGPFSAHSVRELEPHLQGTQLFGHERGAFTGAVARHVGLLEEAADGTLLLDDFHHLRRSVQMMLLRAVGDGQFRPVGGSRDLPVRCRLIVGMTESPDTLVRRGKLLDELRYRLGFSTICLPSMAERREDIPQLAQHLLQRCALEEDKPGPSELAPELVNAFMKAEWPGNVRELAMVIREGYLRAEGCTELRLDHVADCVHVPTAFRFRGDPATNLEAVGRALDLSGGDVQQAATLLGASRSTVYQYVRQLRAGRLAAAANAQSNWTGQTHELDESRATAS